LNGLPGNITPMATSSFIFVMFPLYDAMTTFGPNFQVKPALAERWSLSDDGLRWTFNLRRDVQWPDGRQLTADDVVFTVQSILRDNWPQRSLMATVADIRAVDQFTVELTTRVQDMSILNNTPQVWIVPRHYFEQVGRDGFIRQPMGSGPYELVEFRTGDRAVYRKRPQQHPFRQAIAEELTIRALPEPGAQLAGLRTGELDIVSQVSFNADQVDILRRDGVQILNVPASSLTMAINFTTARARNSPLTDIRVRRALLYALDTPTITRALYRDLSQAIGQPGIPSSPWWDPTVPPHPFDRNRARQLLAEAGYPNGGFRISMTASPGIWPNEVLLAMQAAWKEIGVELDINFTEAGAYIDQIFGRNNATPAEMMPTNSGDSNGFYGSIRTFWGCGRPTPAIEYWCNPEWDQLMDRAYAERDPQRRAELMRQANRLMREQAVVITIAHQPFMTAFGPKIRGINIESPLYYNFDSAYRVR
ncbi:MAG: ABC transporter substrate-binding protein, partial [Dehalococcoidia bacterium]|nr:ABC transporter substrate-binding protein [Dehalococcoidia bacterium]